MKNNLDLTASCSTFPLPAKYEISRDTLITHFKGQFSDKNHLLLLHDAPLKGKSNFLAQFARSNPDRTISFFAGDDYVTCNEHILLRDLCAQMHALATHYWPDKSLPSLDVSPTSTQETEYRVFTDLYRGLRSIARVSGPYYIIIDGVDRLLAEKVPLKLLPTGHETGVYVIWSSSQDIDPLPHDCKVVSIPPLSGPEITALLGTAFSKEEIDHIERISDGLPGYIAEIRRRREHGDMEPVDSLPKDYEAFLSRSLDSINLDDPETSKILCTIAAFPAPLSLDRLSRITGKSREDLDTFLKETGIAAVDRGTSNVQILSGYRRIILKRLSGMRPMVLQDIIRFYEPSKTSEEAHANLALLYREVDDFEGLARLVDSSVVVQVLTETRNTSLVKRNLSILAEMAFDRGDWQRLAWAVLIESLVGYISVSPSVTERKLEALVAMDRVDEAIDMAESAILPEDRLKLYAVIVSGLRAKGTRLPLGTVKDIEETLQLVDERVDISTALLDRLLDACAAVFPISPAKVDDLLRRIAKYSEAPQSSRVSLHDFLVLQLLLRLGPEKGRVSDNEQDPLPADEELRSTKLRGGLLSVDASSILKQADTLGDPRSKAFLLQLWCELHYDKSGAQEVILEALDTIESIPDPIPTQMNVWKLAKPLCYVDDDQTVRELIARFDIIKETAIVSPIDELLRLEVELARAEARWSTDAAQKRVAALVDKGKSYDNPAHLSLLAARLQGLIMELKTSEETFGSEVGLLLDKGLTRLLESSAEQFILIRPVLEVLASFDMERALSLSAALNTEVRRNLAYAESLKHYLLTPTVTPDLQVVGSVLDLITDNLYREVIFVKTVEQLSRNTNHSKAEIMRALGRHLTALQGSISGCYARAHIICWLGDKDPEFSKKLHNEMLLSLGEVDCLWDRAEIGFRLAAIVADANLSFAAQTYSTACDLSSQSVFADERFSSLYIDSCRTAIRMFKDAINSEEAEERFDMLITMIQAITSKTARCWLLSSLGLRCYAGNRPDFFKKAAQQCIGDLEDIKGLDDRYRVLRETAPLLYLYGPDGFSQLLDEFSNDRHDQMLLEVMSYVLSKHPPEDPVSMAKIARLAEYDVVEKLIEIVQRMKTDWGLCAAVSTIVDSLAIEVSARKVRVSLSERQLFIAASRLSEAIMDRLPDRRNIRHSGYLIAAFGYLNRLRDAAVHKRSRKWDEIIPSWSELKDYAYEINNQADRVYVLALLGRLAYPLQDAAGDRFLASAEEELVSLDNHLDHATRYVDIAEGYSKSRPVQAMTYFIQEALSQVQICSREEGRDEYIGKILELAYSIDPDLATSITSGISGKREKWEAAQRLSCMQLRANPRRIDELDDPEIERVLPTASAMLLESFCSGRSTIQHEGVLGGWLRKSMGLGFAAATRTVNLYIEHMLAAKQKSRLQVLPVLSQGMDGIMQLIVGIGGALCLDVAPADRSGLSAETLRLNQVIYSRNEGQQALDRIRSWLSRHAMDPLIIQDPYFDEYSLSLLKDMPQSANIRILLSTKDDQAETVQQRFRASWRLLCDQDPPSISVFVFSSKSGKTPLHDRFILSGNEGIMLGQSISGYGSKDGSIVDLLAGQVESMRRRVIDSIMFPPSRIDEHELHLIDFKL